MDTSGKSLRGPAVVAALLVAASASLAGLPEVPAAGTTTATRPASSMVTLGESVRGRPIRATVVGDRDAPRRILVVGCIHGTEPAGRAITRSLLTRPAPAGTALWIVHAFNPDGCAARTRGNARGVDLNRNQRTNWRPVDPPGGTYYAGPRALSEPESKTIRRLVRRIRPVISVWYHQHAALVDDSGGDRRIERCYARLVKLPFRRFGRPPGSITTWQNTTYSRATALVVELPAGALPPASVKRHVRAVSLLAARDYHACSTASR